LTRDTDKRCPHCRRSLLIPGKWNSKGWYNNLLVMSGVYAQMALLQNIGATLAMALSYGLDPYLPGIIARLPFTTLIFGDFLDWDPNLGVALFGAAILRIAALLVLMLMFYTDLESAADVAIGLSLLDLAWTAAAYTLFGFPGRIPAMVNAALAGLVLLLALLARMARRRGYVRQWTQIDRNATAPLTLHKHGHDYARQGKWALAALHWRRAVAFKPNEAQYCKDLGLAQAQLGRYEAALDALRTGAEAAPEDEEFRTLIAAVEGRMRKAKME
jgi:tetratricopeptide (TPR) repeat protein